MTRAVLVLALVVAAYAQQRAQLSGSVRDVSGAAVVNAIVSVHHESTGVRRTVRTDGQGVYVAAGLNGGDHKITVRKPGFQTVTRLSFPLPPAEAAALDFTLQVGSVREVITIHDSTPEINVDDASAGATAGHGRIQQLPVNGRGFHGLVDLVPGVVATVATAGEAGQFTVNGQRPNTNYFTVDGVSANTGVGGSGLPAQFWGGSLPAMTAFGSTHNLASFQEVQEVRIQTSTYAPEHGRMPGAQVAITTRTGTNEFHGSAFYSFRHDALSANNWFSNAHGMPSTAMRVNHGGANVGGPVRRNQSFFLATVESLHLIQPYQLQSAVPSLATRRAANPYTRPLLEAFPLPNRGDLGGGLAGLFAQVSRPARLDSGAFRFDHALNSRASLFLRYNQAPSSTETGYSQRERSEFSYRSITAGVTAIHTATLSSEFRLNVSSAVSQSSWSSTEFGGARPVNLSNYLPPPDRNATTTYGIAIAGVGQLINGQGGRSRQGQWNLTGTVAANHPSHGLRIGFDYQRLTPKRESPAQGIAGRYASLLEVVEAIPPSQAISRADAAESLIEMLSVFFQDTWRPAPRLSNNYGTRWEITPAPFIRDSAILLPGNQQLPLNTSYRLWPTRYTQWAPRAGLAYRLADRLVVRAGWGLFYDLGFSAATDPINGYPFNRWQFLGGALTPSTGTVPLGGRRYAPNLRLPYAHHWNTAFDVTLTRSDVLGIGYVGAAGRHLLRREGIPQAGTPIADLVIATNNGRSDYHSLQLHYRRRLSHGLQATAAYTLGHAIDNGSWDSALARTDDQYRAAVERASSAFDTRHSFSASLIVQSPFRSGWLGRWQLSSTARARSGFPIDLLVSENLLGLGFDNVTRPDVVAGQAIWIRDPLAPGGLRLNRAAFARPASGQGSLGRNALTGFGMWQVDAALQRRFSFRDRFSLDLQLESFNLANQAAFSDPVRFLDSPLFGVSASPLSLMLGAGSPRAGLAPVLQSGSPRSLQLTVRFSF
jgi:hypothetical protein